MDLAQIAKYGRTIQLSVGAGTRAEVEQAVAQLADDEAWELFSALLLSASELAARLMVAKALEKKVYAPLAAAACLRRHNRPPAVQRRGGAAKRVFMDIDLETAQAGVPDYIQAEQEDLSALAAGSREIAARREAERDADPIRILIVNELAHLMLTSEGALEALVAIVQASAWEDTRRSAALKLVNNPLALRRLADAARTDDLVAVGACCRLTSAAEKVALLLTPHLEALVAAKSPDALALLARYHPNAAIREQATRAVLGS